MRITKMQKILPVLFGFILILAGCETGDDLSEPLPGPGPIEQYVNHISGMAVLGEHNTYIFDSWGDETLLQTEYYAVIEDTVVLKGFQWPGGAILQKNAVFSPLYPELNTAWWGLNSHKFTVVDSGNVTVPAGTFPAFVIERTDSLSGELMGSVILADEVGIIALVNISEDLALVLDDYDLQGGEGVFPLEIGNEWTMVEGEYSLAE